MRTYNRLGVAVFLAVLSLVSVSLLLPNSSFGSRLQRIASGTSVDSYSTLWNWASDEYDGGDRLVVFGDSWVDDSVRYGKDGQGRSWPTVLCAKINCSSHVNFAVSQPSGTDGSAPPTGAIMSNQIYLSSIDPPETQKSHLLPDLATQVQNFIAHPPPLVKADESIFVISLGLGDIYYLASLDYQTSQKLIDDNIDELLKQLDILHWQYASTFTSVHLSVESTASSNHSDSHIDWASIPPFRVVIPKVFDPTLLPGWLSQRPAASPPSSFAEQQKNAVYLTRRWNSVLETKVGAWMKAANVMFEQLNEHVSEESSEDASKESNKDVAEEPSKNRSLAADIRSSEKGSEGEPEKDVLLYDMPQYLLDIIATHDLLEVKQVTGSTKPPPTEIVFQSVYEPCVVTRPADKPACDNPDDYLFWDVFNLGSMAKEAIAKQIDTLVRDRR